MIFPLIQLAVVTTFPLVNPINSGVRTGSRIGFPEFTL